jgi:hypothetical protein
LVFRSFYRIFHINYLLYTYYSKFNFNVK